MENGYSYSIFHFSFEVKVKMEYEHPFYIFHQQLKMKNEKLTDVHNLLLVFHLQWKIELTVPSEQVDVRKQHKFLNNLFNSEKVMQSDLSVRPSVSTLSFESNLTFRVCMDQLDRSLPGIEGQSHRSKVKVRSVQPRVMAALVLAVQEARTASEYTPFGVGPKGCVGQYLAMIEMKAIMALLLRRYRVTISTGDRHLHAGSGLDDASQTLDTVSTRWDIAQQPTTPTYMRLIPRSHPASE